MGHEFPARHPKDRTCHQQDRDRILHCEAFRRLGYKTQVFVIHEGDFYRTRLTHSLEVAQIARGIACALGANEDLCEAVAYAHDLGHPPFGHRGEGALDALLGDFLERRLGIRRPDGGKAFEQNFQSFRIVARLERRYLDFPGLNLTRSTLEGILRHATAFDTPVIPYPVAQADPVLTAHGRAVSTIALSPSVEAQIVNVADQVAWVTHDLEDALRVRFLRREDLAALDNPLIHTAVSRLGHSDLAERDGVLWGRLLIRNMIDLLISDTVHTSLEDPDSGRGETEVKARTLPLVRFSPETALAVEGVRRHLLEKVYTNPVVERMSLKAHHILSRMFEDLTRDILEPDSMSARLLPSGTRTRLEEAPEGVGKALVVTDFLAGMTDRFATEFYRVLYEPDERSITSLY
jgi:dGTPase